MARLDGCTNETETAEIDVRLVEAKAVLWLAFEKKNDLIKKCVQNGP